jgi:excisionase family DNA binding protein
MTFDTYDTKRSLTTGEVAERCEVSIGAVKKWIQQGKLGAVRTPGGHFRVSADEFERFQATYNFPPAVRAERRVLIVEDDRALAAAIRKILATLRPAPRVDVVYGGSEGLLRAGTFRPHLVILDVYLPGLDGLEVCRRIKSDPVTGPTHVVVITGDQDIRPAALTAGADAFLVKPFSASDLKRETQRLLTATPPGAP